MGGDFAPDTPLKGIQQFLSDEQMHQNEVIFYALGEEVIVRPLLNQYQIPAAKVKFIPCGSSVNFSDSPTKIFREKSDSSLAAGFQLLASGEIDAFISAGHTGGMLVGAHTIIKPIDNVLRPCIGAVVPRTDCINNPGFVLDVGSNVECKPEQLNQMAVLGSVYLKTMYNLENPTVGLLNVGEEPTKGTSVHVEAHKLLSNNPKINFVGNVEGRDILANKVNVIVCDGFVGNVVLKMTESIYDELRLAKLQNDPNEDRSYFKYFNFEEHGGTPVLGVKKTVIIGHGISTAKAFKKMFSVAIQLEKDKFCHKIEQALTV